MYVDLQWICEVHCNADGTYRIISGTPDPMLERSGLRVMEVFFIALASLLLGVSASWHL
jgi:hypothetical protein